MATKTPRSPSSPAPPIPREALAELEARLGRSLAGWDAAPPLWVSPPPEQAGARFDVEAVVRVVKALRALRHTKGKWAGAPLEPDVWQIVWVLAPIFGWKDGDGNRVVRTVWVEVPRKAGKSTIASGIALVLLAADGEQGAEVYSAAASEAQARIVFDEAKKMARQTPALKGKVKLFAKAITAPSTSSSYRVLSKVAETAHGLNVHGAIVDEVHVHKSRDLIDALETGTGAREQPLILFITTADEGDDTSIYAEKHGYTISLAKRVATDPSFYGVIWAADEKDDPFDERTWRKANPGLGITVKVDFLRREAERAKALPSYYATFCRLYLNLRTRNETRFLNIRDWDACAGGLVEEERLEGVACYGGLDLASTTDVAAFVLDFPQPDGTHDLLCRFWVPKDTLGERVKRDRIPYDVWERQGWLSVTEGNVVDYAAIKAEILRLRGRFGIQEIAYDRWNASQLVLELQDEGLTMVPMGQGFASMTAPTKQAQSLILSKRARHHGNPVLRWMADNLVVLQDPAGNLKPARHKSRGKIDGMVAWIMALDRAVRNEVTEWAFGAV